MSVLAAALFLAVPSWADQSPSPPRVGNEIPKERSDAPAIHPYKIILVGDSTMAPHSGWGGAFCADHVQSNIACLNLGRGGRSTRSYRAEGSWDVALGEMKAPGYRKTFVLIQMAHNDQSSKAERWTDMVKEFPDNLRRFVAEARAAGVVPVLVTPLSRREFRKGELYNTLIPWADQVRAVARELNVPLIDLNADSAAAVAKMGPVAAMDLAMTPPSNEELAAAKTGTTLPPRAGIAEPTTDAKREGARGRFRVKFDYTHVGPKGAALFSGMVADDLAKAVPELASQLLP
jgi:lysophospholipase L1-like esterase